MRFRSLKLTLAYLGLMVAVLSAMFLGYNIASLTGGNLTSRTAVSPSESEPEQTDEALNGNIITETAPMQALVPERSASPTLEATIALPSATSTAVSEPTPPVPTTFTATPEPTPPVPPTSTATLVEPSNTPEVTTAGTPTTSEDVSVFVQDDFENPASGWPTRETESWSAGYVNGRYQLTLKNQRTIGFSSPLSLDNYRLAVDLTVTSQASAGLIFLFANPTTFYHFVVTAEGAYALQRIEGDKVINVENGVENSAFRRPIGTPNHLQIERQGGTVRFFANDQLLTTFTVPEGQFDNRYGFVLTSPRNQGRATFDNLRGERIPER